jgi:hypothetical protein
METQGVRREAQCCRDPPGWQPFWPRLHEEAVGVQAVLLGERGKRCQHICFLHSSRHMEMSLGCQDISTAIEQRPGVRHVLQAATRGLTYIKAVLASQPMLDEEDLGCLYPAQNAGRPELHRRG